MATQENTSRVSAAEFIDQIFDIQAIAISAAALAGSEIGGGNPVERVMLQVGEMLGKLAADFERIEREGGAA